MDKLKNMSEVFKMEAKEDAEAAGKSKTPVVSASRTQNRRYPFLVFAVQPFNLFYSLLLLKLRSKGAYGMICLTHCSSYIYLSFTGNMHDCNQY